MTNYRENPPHTHQDPSHCKDSNKAEAETSAMPSLSYVVNQHHNNRRKRAAGRPKASGQTGRYRRESRQPNRAIISRNAVMTMQRGYDQAIALKRPLTTFITVRWAYSRQRGKSPADTVSKFLTAASGFFRRKSSKMTYIVTLENPPTSDDGFHLHMLVHVPKGLKGAFEKWVVAYVGGETRAVDIRPASDRGALSYICKACHPFTAKGLGWKIETNTWKFGQGFMPDGLRRWRMSADIQTKPPAKAGYRRVSFTDRTGAEIREARLMRCWSQQHLADLAGLNRNTIIRLERFDRIPESSQYALGRVERALRVGNL